ncbi:hypothetical protein Pmar_PMAR018037 [Perkinsus marinus ATCC 50983]|uniref:RanBP2-type domain-containing protein n=1 Tax=Perkinsus marinus (strain ATCC 50983 / TXsc) TaxID=423536 RepID=C5KRU2_PERM5|nr:hypothetical protein Pmar_PMAR018037 [Perkinsus marinus ATCC 50983]EER12783.1 hypothetical protein Pmar_PMAR018037 [Perkinsus marinus ATCC 50983]|eukprot:XP_002780988.1 hypothetical protein Pmar_PMAR018037 [Perkinsus marinus ATCC 50983]
MRRRSRSRSGDRSSTRKHEKKEKKREKKHHKHSKKTKEADESLEMEALRMLAKQNADDMLLPMDFGSVGYGGERDPRDKAFSTAFGMSGMNTSTTGFVAEREKPDTKVRPPRRGDKPGPQDWVCPKCQTINFKQATDCFKCGRLRGSANAGFFQTPNA